MLARFNDIPKKQALQAILSEMTEATYQAAQGGWKVHRHRTDKSANAPKVALSILTAIQGVDLSDDLQSLLSSIKPTSFRPQIGKKRARDNSEDNDSDIDDMLH